MQLQDEELDRLRATLTKEKQKAKRIWREKCEQQLSHEEAIYGKDMEIARLKGHLLGVTSPSSPPMSPGSSICIIEEELHRLSLSHQWGKALPINLFTAESLDEQWDDWPPTFERAAKCNGWTDSEHLLQLASHLKGKARQEFALLSADDKVTFASAIVAIRGKLDTSCSVSVPFGWIRWPVHRLKMRRA